MWFRTIFRRKKAGSTGSKAGTELAGLALPPRIFAQLDRLHLRSTRYLLGSGAGQRPSTRRRPAADFREHRKYVMGDDVRFVDWKASARSEQIFLKQGELPQETNIHLIIDTSASMAWGSPPKSHAVLRLAAALGYLALSSDDRLQVIPIKKQGGGNLEQVFKGKGQFPALLNHLRQLTFEGTADLKETIEILAKKHRGGLVIILSDLLDMPDSDLAFVRLPRPAWEVKVLHTLHPAELIPDISGDLQMQDLETGAVENYDITAQGLETYHRHLESWRSALELACIESRAHYALLSTGMSLEMEILPLLHRAGILEPAA